MNKQQFRAAYRQARLAAGFISDMTTAKCVQVSSMYTTLDQCPGFVFSRLHGDCLHTVVGHLGRVTHNARMWDLRRRPRLP